MSCILLTIDAWGDRIVLYSCSLAGHVLSSRMSLHVLLPCKQQP